MTESRDYLELKEPLIKSKMPLASQVFSDQDELLQA
ncbi:hypothetical protein SAMN02745866_03042 [Alteromonadaceae bacterium Bs31]|nr:hypothetical protein SAMN02745866_03042 [Alteromonadaceae bacterium Bs31]